MLGRMFLKVVLVLAVTFVGMGLVVKGVGGHVGSLVHSPVDLSLTQDVGDHTWVPVLHGHPVAGQRLGFGSGQVHSAACRGDLGSYSLRIDHRFSFQPRHGACRAARPMQHTLARATRATVTTQGNHQVLVLADGDRTVLTLRSRP